MREALFLTFLLMIFGYIYYDNNREGEIEKYYDDENQTVCYVYNNSPSSMQCVRPTNAKE